MKRLLLLTLLLFIIPATARAASVPCHNAPASRLHAGEAAMIVADQLNLRALPAVATGIEVQLYRGTRATVLDGPSCNGAYNWWRVELENGTRGWVAEGTWLAYYVIPARDADRTTPTPLEFSCLDRFDNRPCYLP